MGAMRRQADASRACFDMPRLIPAAAASALPAGAHRAVAAAVAALGRRARILHVSWLADGCQGYAQPRVVLHLGLHMPTRVCNAVG